MLCFITSEWYFEGKMTLSTCKLIVFHFNLIASFKHDTYTFLGLPWAFSFVSTPCDTHNLNLMYLGYKRTCTWYVYKRYRFSITSLTTYMCYWSRFEFQRCLRGNCHWMQTPVCSGMFLIAFGCPYCRSQGSCPRLTTGSNQLENSVTWDKH